MRLNVNVVSIGFVMIFSVLSFINRYYNALMLLVWQSINQSLFFHAPKS